MTLSERAIPYWVGKAKFAFLPVAPLRSVSVEILKIRPETILNEHDKRKYTSVLLERHFSSGNTAVPVTRPHALANVIIHK